MWALKSGAPECCYRLFGPPWGSQEFMLPNSQGHQPEFVLDLVLDIVCYPGPWAYATFPLGPARTRLADLGRSCAGLAEAGRRGEPVCSCSPCPPKSSDTTGDTSHSLRCGLAVAGLVPCAIAREPDC